MATRPRCACHDLPMLRNGGSRWRCAEQVRAYNARNNPRRLRVFGQYLGTVTPEQRAILEPLIERRREDRRGVHA